MREIEKQLAGIEMVDRILKDVVHAGVCSAVAPDFRVLQIRIRELSEYDIGGILDAFSNFLLEITNIKNDDFSLMIEQINYIYALLKKSTDYLETRKEDPEKPIPLDTPIEEQIGKLWAPSELKEAGLWEENAEISQLSFNCHNNLTQKVWTDEGIWLNMKTGAIYKTVNKRPYPVADRLKIDDSVFGILKIKEMYFYPGYYNPKIRWLPGNAEERPFDTNDLNTIHSLASEDYAALLPEIKARIKNPLSDKNPVVLVKLQEVCRYGEYLVIKDKFGNKLTLADINRRNFPASLPLLKKILPGEVNGYALTLLFHYKMNTGLLAAQPMSLITPTQIIRLLY
jgi:hypothetical protein